MPDHPEILALHAVLRERDLASRWNKSLRFLQRLRASRRSPPWFRIGATVYYRAEDVLSYEAARMQDGADR